MQASSPAHLNPGSVKETVWVSFSSLDLGFGIDSGSSL